MGNFWDCGWGIQNFTKGISSWVFVSEPDTDFSITQLTIWPAISKSPVLHMLESQTAALSDSCIIVSLSLS